MIKKTLAGLSVLTIPFVTGTAYAQMAPVQAQDPHADLTVGVKGLYDGNVASGSEELAEQRNLKRQDFRITPGISADVYKPVGPGYVSVNASAGYDFYAHNKRLERERIEGTLGAGAILGPCGIGTSTGFSRKQSDLNDLTDDGTNTQNIETRFNTGAMIGCGAIANIQPYIVLQYETARNSADQRKGSNSDNFTYGGGLMYSQPSVGELRVFALQRDVDFQNRDQIEYLGASSLRVRQFGGQFSRDIGAKLGAFVMLAYTDLDKLGEGASGDGFNGLTWQAKLTLRASDRLRFQASATKDTSPSLGLRVDYTERTEYALQADMSFTTKVGAQIVLSHRERNFSYSSIPDVTSLTDDKIDSIKASFSVRQIGPFNVSVDTTYENRTANLESYEYDALSAGISLSMLI